MRKASKADVLTPANAITTLGLLLTAAGAFRLDTPAGFWLVAIGKLLDVVDGPVARRTHTSNFGAYLDVIADKISVLILLVATYYFHLVPLPFLLFIFAYHGAISVMGLDALVHKLDADPSRLGKYTMFLHIVTMILFVYANVFTPLHHIVMIVAIILGIISIIMGTISLTLYIQDYIRKVYKPFHTNH